MKILVAIPCNQYVETECIDGLFKTVHRLRSFCEFDVRFYKGYSCEQARNKAIKDLVESDADYIWFIDSDIKIGLTDFEKLLLSCCSICTGIYFRKIEDEKIAEICRLNCGETTFYKDYEIPENKLFQISACGFGCILIKRDVCEYLYNITNGRPFVYQFEPDLISEDLWFCNLANSSGYQIFANSEVIVGHVGKKIY